jgi:glycosyltransferase involved in cell wall biosynthesis
VRVAHLVVVTPGRCGLYETTRELVAGLRAQGVDSRMVDPTREKNKLHPAGTEDRGALFAPMDWALQADVISNHSGYDNTPLEKSHHPVVHVAHGRPRSSFISEAKGSTPIYSYWYQKSKDPRFAAVVTFWPEHEPYLQVMMPDKPIHVVQSSVDLKAWTPDGPSGYGFHGKNGRINIVSTDAFRDDIDPFIPLHAAALWARKAKGVKIHVYAKPAKSKGWDALLRRIQDDGNLGEVCGWTTGLANVYRAANFMITAQDIATRSIRESMACGCPVVRMHDLDHGWEQRMLDGLMTNRKGVRHVAEISFNPQETVKQFKAVLEAVPRKAALRVA